MIFASLARMDRNKIATKCKSQYQIFGDMERDKIERDIRKKESA